MDNHLVHYCFQLVLQSIANAATVTPTHSYSSYIYSNHFISFPNLFQVLIAISFVVLVIFVLVLLFHRLILIQCHFAYPTVDLALQSVDRSDALDIRITL